MIGETPVADEFQHRAEKTEQLGALLQTFSETGKLGELDRELVKSVLAEFGANFENLDDEGKRSLSKYSNKGKHSGMEQVWGLRRGEFRKWVEDWVLAYEQKTRESLPVVIFTDRDTGEKTTSKTEGMRQFLGEITAYAAGCLEFSQLKSRLEARHINFKRPADKPAEGGGRVRIIIPGYNKAEGTGKEIPFAPASFPPEFLTDAWSFIKSWKR